MYPYRQYNDPPYYHHQSMIPYMQMAPPIQMHPQQTRRGGLLSRMFRKKNTEPQPFQQMIGHNWGSLDDERRMAGAGIAQSLGNLGPTGLANVFGQFSSGEGIVGTLNNIQKVIGLTQQITPMVQQYGPLLKNMPAMYKIFKEVNSSDSTDSIVLADVQNDITSTNDSPSIIDDTEIVPSLEVVEPKIKPAKISQKHSTPKLYI